VVDDPSKRLDETRGNPLSGSISGAIAVSECFQNTFHTPVAGRRDTGLSLWQPDAHWAGDAAIGPRLSYLPESVWLAGLGHLGQAYAWVLGLLDYPEYRSPKVQIQDVDQIARSNLSTSLLAGQSDLGIPKTRLVASHLERRGSAIAIVERKFDAQTKRQPIEPGLVLSGFDNFEAHHALGSAGFELIVDAGLGSSYDRYLNILIHSFLKGFEGKAPV
jgi:hypothetical protein